MSGSISRINNSTIDEAQIRIYGSVTLSNGAIVCTSQKKNSALRQFSLHSAKIKKFDLNSE